VTAPATLQGLLAIKTRSRFGKLELRTKYPHLMASQPQNRRGRSIMGLLLRPSLWPCLPVYGYVCLVTSVRARMKAKSGGARSWERDDTSRATMAAAGES